jgi:hypothetical protein
VSGNEKSTVSGNEKSTVSGNEKSTVSGNVIELLLLSEFKLNVNSDIKDCSMYNDSCVHPDGVMFSQECELIEKITTVEVSVREAEYRMIDGNNIIKSYQECKFALRNDVFVKYMGRKSKYVDLCVVSKSTLRFVCVCKDIQADLLRRAIDGLGVSVIQ